MAIKKQLQKPQQKRKTKSKRAVKRRAQTMWHPSNYLLESNATLGLPECKEEIRAYASTV